MQEFRVCHDRFGASQSIEVLDYVDDCPACGEPTRKHWKPFLQVRVPVPLARLDYVVELLSEHWVGPLDGPVGDPKEEP